MTRPLSRSERSRLDRAFLKAHRLDAIIRQHGYCIYCTEPISGELVTADHVHPKAKGGSDGADNLVGACRPCNAVKGDMSAKAFMRLLRDPPAGASIHIHLAAARLRIWSATHATCGRISKAVGIGYRMPKWRKFR